MKKFDLNLDYDGIRRRIEADKGEMRPTDWARKVGVSPAAVCNIHSQTVLQPPSLQYVVACARATGRSVDWYLYGKEPGGAPAPVPAALDPHAELLSACRRICAAGGAADIDELAGVVEAIEARRGDAAPEEALRMLTAKVEALAAALGRLEHIARLEAPEDASKKRQHIK